MIIKSFEINKIDPFKNNLILFYGQNEGLKDENILKLSSKFHNIIKYHEREVLENQDNFFESIFSGSLFDEDKFVIINQASDKIVKIIEILIEKKEKIKEIAILLNANSLEKKSKLRSIFEKNLLCVPFYIDNNETLFKFTETFLKQKKINISPLNINFLVNKCNGDRRNLKNELHKIEMFCLNKKNIKDEELQEKIDSGDIKFYGRLKDVRSAIEQSSVYVLPSYREGTPRTVLEAMAMGRPIITTNAPGCKETVVDGENGYLVPIKDVDALVKAMKIFIKEPKLIYKMGANSRLIAEQKYDVKIVNCEMMNQMGIR